MPHKFNAERRRKIPRQKHRVTNWSDYNESLRRRVDLTVWISDAAPGLWKAPPRTTRGGQQRYSELAIEVCLTLGMFFKLPLRQTQGLMRSIASLLGIEIAVPDFSTLSRRSSGLALQPRSRVNSTAALHLAVDSTGLKIFGEGEWLEEKHKNKANCKSWRKLHLGLDLLSGEIVCANLTTDDVGDATALPELLDQIDSSVGLFLADGAYDGSPTRDLLIHRFGSALDVVIPPPKNANFSSNMAQDPNFRDYHIAQIKTHGRVAWQSASGYNQRSRVETLMGRWKAIIGPKLKARSFAAQTTEANIGVRVLNKMTELGRPNCERTA